MDLAAVVESSRINNQSLIPSFLYSSSSYLNPILNGRAAAASNPKGMIPNKKRPTFLVAAPTEPSWKIEMYSPAFYAACTAGGILSRELTHMTVTPLDLIKCNMQEGVRALWTGIGPNVARNAIINAAELASYDQVKEAILKIPGFTDNVVTHLIAGLGAGFFSACVGSPVDVVKSRMMGNSSAYKNTIDCFVKTLKNDGPLAFYKGFIPNFGQLGSWNVIMFLTLEQV